MWTVAGKLERFTVTHPLAEYHYTLYYYDQAGNLVKTVAPEGVWVARRTTWLDSVATVRSTNDVLPASLESTQIYKHQRNKAPTTASCIIKRL